MITRQFRLIYDRSGCGGLQSSLLATALSFSSHAAPDGHSAPWRIISHSSVGNRLNESYGVRPKISGGGKQRIGPLAGDRKIASVAERPPPLASGDLLDDIHLLQIGQCRNDCRRRQARLLDKLVGDQERVLLNEVVDLLDQASQLLTKSAG